MVLETDELVPQSVLDEILQVEQVVDVRFVEPI
jgi:hypothetical protein